ncbi:hypothetical protein COO60DRAFT_1478733 [Scenedesmus sp. NREL 46B-D3]|nr:hypothetical protein COO60DRAFT_1478733 [Scenedesmus sp. NREL 46B-D3]
MGAAHQQRAYTKSALPEKTARGMALMAMHQRGGALLWPTQWPVHAALYTHECETQGSMSTPVQDRRAINKYNSASRQRIYTSDVPCIRRLLQHAYVSISCSLATRLHKAKVPGFPQATQMAHQLPQLLCHTPRTKATIVTEASGWMMASTTNMMCGNLPQARLVNAVSLSECSLQQPQQCSAATASSTMLYDPKHQAQFSLSNVKSPTCHGPSQQPQQRAVMHTKGSHSRT